MLAELSLKSPSVRAFPKEDLGKVDGFADRAVVADALFAKTDKGAAPRLLLSDTNVVKTLFRMTGGDVVRAGGYKGIVKVYGSTGFKVVIKGRKLWIVPLPTP